MNLDYMVGYCFGVVVGMVLYAYMLRTKGRPQMTKDEFLTGVGVKPAPALEAIVSEIVSIVHNDTRGAPGALPPETYDEVRKVLARIILPTPAKWSDEGLAALAVETWNRLQSLSLTEQPCDVIRAALNEAVKEREARLVPDSMVEALSAELHNAWWEQSKKAGRHAPMDCARASTNLILRQGIKFDKLCDKCRPDMYPYEELSEEVKEYDRVTVRAVLAAQAKFAALPSSQLAPRTPLDLEKLARETLSAIDDAPSPGSAVCRLRAALERAASEALNRKDAEITELRKCHAADTRLYVFGDGLWAATDEKSAQQIREAKAEVARLTAENAVARDTNRTLNRHNQNLEHWLAMPCRDDGMFRFRVDEAVHQYRVIAIKQNKRLEELTVENAELRKCHDPDTKLYVLGDGVWLVTDEHSLKEIKRWKIESQAALAEPKGAEDDKAVED
jgi:hypothetical protein